MEILLVEDDAFFQKFYQMKLSEKQFVVTIAGNGAEALERARARRPDIVLLDLIMPQSDGFAFLTARKADPNLASVPVIVFSTLGQEQDIEKAKTLGANDYVNKSFLDFDLLLSKIQAHLPK